jgi:hypothetical protein
MAFQLAPWLQPPDFLRSIDQGANLGLGLRRNDLEQARMAQQAQQAAAELQQSWAEKMMANTRMAEQNRLTRESNDLYRAGMLDSRNRGLDIQETKANKPPAEPSGFSLTPGQTRFDSNGNPIATLPQKDTQPKPIQLNVGQLKDWKQLEEKEATFKLGPEITPGSYFRPAVTNTPSAMSNDDLSRLQTYRNNQALLNGGTNAPMFAPATPIPAAGNPGGGTLTGRVRVVGPNGKTGTVSASSLEEALRSGYKQVK